jgi:hypothetical protein
MQGNLKVTLICVALLFLSGAIYPQTPSAATTGCAATGVTTPPGPSHMVQITGAPYSGDDEHYIRPPGAFTLDRRVYRDSAGREREESVCVSGSSSNGPTAVHILDPVSGFQYVLDMQKHIAYRALLTVVYAPSVSATHPEVLYDIPKVNRELLGTQTIEGLVASGTKVSETWPVDPRSGQPRVHVCEQWIASELRVMILFKCYDSRGHMGDLVVHLAHISRDEPIPTLFQVPPNFTIIDDAGPIR